MAATSENCILDMNWKIVKLDGKVISRSREMTEKLWLELYINERGDGQP